MFENARLLSALAATGVVLGAVYMLYLYQRVMLGPLTNPQNRKLQDMSARGDVCDAADAGDGVLAGYLPEHLPKAH